MSFLSLHPIKHFLFCGGVCKAELIKQLEMARVQLNPLAVQLFSSDAFVIEATQRHLTAIQISVAQLGLSNGGTFKDVTSKALAHGYYLCPLELGPHLRLVLANQQEGSIGQDSPQNCAPPGSITIASEPIFESDDEPKGFYLRVIEGNLWLRGYRSWDGHIWSPQDVFVFIVK
jgi:hypothetical protein